MNTYKATVGDIVQIADIDFVILDDYDALGPPEVFVVTIDPITVTKFGETNNYTESRIRKVICDWYSNRIVPKVDPDLILWSTIDLRTLSGDEDYDELTTKARPLTLDEYRDCSAIVSAELRLQEDGMWLATGWGVSELSQQHGLCAEGKTLNARFCTSSHGVHPAMVVSKKLLQQEPKTWDVESLHPANLEGIPTNVLLDELSKRFEEGR